MGGPRDVQSEILRKGFKLTRVGVTGVRKPVQVRRPSRDVTLNVTMDLFVDLPSNLKGSHMSRNLEAIGEIVDKSIREPAKSLEDMACTIAADLLERHEYATRSEVDATADYFLERETPLGRKSLERYEIMVRASARRNEAVATERCVGVKVVGMTACPCAMETVRHNLSDSDPTYDDYAERFPTITHNQRNVTSLMIDVPPGRDVEADDLIEIVESSLSSPTYEMLKREDEAKVVERAHANPRFVEDVVRDILAMILKTYEDFPDGVCVRVKSESEESIHKHNAFAERVTSLGELRG
jgi:GTP cyclohydrolase-4